MVNLNQGKVYEPIPYYDRKLNRSIIRQQVINKSGYHNVNKRMAEVFKSLREDKNEV